MFHNFESSRFKGFSAQSWQSAESSRLSEPYRFFASTLGPSRIPNSSLNQSRCHTPTARFVSHYWGTSFAHFVFSIKKHSETVVEQLGHVSREASLLWGGGTTVN